MISKKVITKEPEAIKKVDEILKEKNVNNRRYILRSIQQDKNKRTIINDIKDNLIKKRFVLYSGDITKSKINMIKEVKRLISKEDSSKNPIIIKKVEKILKDINAKNIPKIMDLVKADKKVSKIIKLIKTNVVDKRYLLVSKKLPTKSKKIFKRIKTLISDKITLKDP